MNISYKKIEWKYKFQKKSFKKKKKKDLLKDIESIRIEIFLKKNIPNKKKKRKNDL